MFRVSQEFRGENVKSNNMNGVIDMAMEIYRLIDEISRLPLYQQKNLLRTLGDKLEMGIPSENEEKRIQKGLIMGFGAWTDENHPDLKTDEDIESF